ncbi:tetratricopeptide repeat protein [Hydrogenimonas sp. SS33]|uniref:tetratricopeptide repeat protein n=1 Tax=Hydrogenimonas leucolamina TaxID=2954236 RepID=UPI00336BFC57
MSNAPKNRPRVISDTEIFLLITLFGVILYILYPKTFIQKQLLSEKSNYDLTLTYLENLLPLEKKNEALMLKLVESALETGRISLARRVCAKLIASHDPQTQRRAFPLWYRIEKQNYFSTKDAAARKRIREELAGILELMEEKGMTGTKEASKWYDEAVWLGKDAMALRIALGILRKDPDNLRWLERSYYLAARCNDLKTAETLLKKLIRRDRNRAERWRDALASLYVKENRIEEAATLYLQAYRRHLCADEFFKALDLLTWHHENEKAVQIARKYEKSLRAEKAAEWKLLRFYLSANALDDAHRMALTLFGQCGAEENTKQCNTALLYKTFLYASDPSHAYEVAELALKAKKTDDTWQLRAARSAMWSGRPQDAMRHYLEAYRLHPTAALRKKLLPMLIANYRYESALQLAIETARSHPDDRKTIETLVYLYDKVGYPEGAIDFLMKAYEKNHRTFLLSKALQLALDMGDMVKAGSIVSIFRKRGIKDYTTARRVAYFEYLQRRPSVAYEIVKKQLTKIDKKVPTDFLQLASDLAWYLGKYDDAGRYALALLERGAARSVDRQRTVDVYRESNPKVALEAAWQIYESDPTPAHFIEFAYLAVEQGAYKRLLSEFEKIKKDDRLLSDVRFWTIKAHLMSALHRQSEAYEALKKALGFSPHDPTLRAEMLWMMIDTADCRALRTYVSTLEKEGVQNSEMLWPPLIAAHMRLQEGDMAMLYLKRLMKREGASVDRRLTYAYLLQGCNENEAFMRQMEKIKRKLDTEATGTPARMHDPDFLEKYLQAAMFTMNPDRFSSLLQKSKRSLPTQRYLQLEALWALRNGEYERARATLYKLNDPEAWMQLTLALHFYDTYRMSDLLDRAVCRLPVRDRVDGAVRSGRVGLAQSLAFEGMESNRFDELLYYQNEQLERRWADEWRATLSTDTRRSLQQSTAEVANRNAIGGGWYLFERIRERINGSWDDDVYRNLPKNDTRAEANLLHHGDRMDLSLAAALRTGLEDHLQLEGSIDYRIDNRWRGAMALAWHKDALQTDYLAIGGMEDSVKLRTDYALLSSTTITTTAGYSRFHSQDGVYLGDGIELRLESYTTLRIGYPDIAISFFGEYGTYDEKDGNKGVLEEIMAVPGKVLAEDYLNVGTGLYWGYQNKESYVRPWRPYFSLSPYADLIGHNLNVAFDGGIGGNLFNQDHWAVGVGYTPGISNNTESVLRAYLQYRMLY